MKMWRRRPWRRGNRLPEGGYPTNSRTFPSRERLPPMSKVISYSTLARQQQLNFLKHKIREYRERDDYLLRLRKHLFQVEAQMRQAEIQQLEVFQEIAAHFKIPLPLPDLGDRLGMQQLF